MNKSIIKVALYDAKEYDIESFTNIKNRNIKYTFIDSKLTMSNISLANGHQAICVFVNDIVSKDIIKKLSSYGIKAIFLRCAGYNNIDLSSCSKYGISVYRVPAYSPYAVAEHAFALLSTINRRIHKAYIRTRDHNFSLIGLTGMDLYNKTIGIIGTGKIGKVMIDIAKGYHMHVLAYDPYIDTSLDVEYVSLEELFNKSDIISLHCPLTASNRHLINNKTISLMKKGVVIINTSRGALINSNDLYDGLLSRQIGAACLDVYEEEANIFFTNVSNHILEDKTLSLLISLPNVIVTSHQAFLTKEALRNIAEVTNDNIMNYFVYKIKEGTNKVI